MEAQAAQPQELYLHGKVDLTNEQYHSAPGVSKGQLDAIAVSPLNYWDQFVNPEREPREFKHCFAVGDGTHKLVLEPGTFEQTYAVGFDKSAYPEALDLVADLKKECTARGLMVSGSKGELCDRLIEDGFEPGRLMPWLLRQHEKTMAGRIAISAAEYKNMLGMLRAVNNHHTAAGLLEGAKVEQSFFVTDDQGILRKCRPDIITANGLIMPDLKTTDDVSEIGFGRTIAQRRYHVQAAYYLDLLFMLYGDAAPRHFCFIAVQKTRPYDVAVHYLTDDIIAIGRALYQRDLQRLIECRDANRWPGTDNGEIIKANLPPWAMNGEPVYL
jgi:exodeoxyribonuclease VIII